MGKFVNYVRNEKGFILSLVLMILGIAFGDASVLMAEGVTVAPPAPEGGTATEGHEGLQTQLGGQDASVTTLERGGETGDIIAEDIDEDIAKFRPDFFPIDTVARKAAKKKRKTNYVVKHYNIDASRITCITNAEHIARLKEGGLTMANVAEEFGLHPDCFRQYLKEHEPELHASLGMKKTENGGIMAPHSMGKYAEALQLYSTTTESIKSLARRFGFNDCSFGQFIRRHFPELHEQHKELVRQMKEAD